MVPPFMSLPHLQSSCPVLTLPPLTQLGDTHLWGTRLLLFGSDETKALMAAHSLLPDMY